MVGQSCVVTAAKESKFWIRFANNKNCLMPVCPHKICWPVSAVWASVGFDLILQKCLGWIIKVL